MSEQERGDSGVSRLSFIKASAGAAAGAVALGVPVAAVLSDGTGDVVREPSSGTPQEPVMAYVRDAERGEVTVLHGTTETTYRDRALVKRLLSAAPNEPIVHGGDIDVLAP